MRIGAGLLLIAVGAILRFGISTVSTHGIAIHTIGDILIIVGVLGVVLWMVVSAPWSGRRRPPTAATGRVYREEPVYREERSVYREEHLPTRCSADEIPPTGTRTGTAADPAGSPGLRSEPMASPDMGLPPNIGTPATRALTAAGYTELSQLAGVPAAELGKLHGVGPKALRLLQEALHEQGMSLAHRLPTLARTST